MARQCTQPKRPRNAAWFKEKEMLAEAQESDQIFDEEQLAFLADPGIPNGQAAQITIPNTAVFQTEGLDAYDSDCDDVSNAKAVLMANLSNYGSDIISEVPHFEPYHTDMDNQSVHAMQGFEQTLVVDFTDNEITSDSNIISYSQYLQETQQEAVQDTNLDAQQDSSILSVIEQMSEQMINHKAQRIKPTLYDSSVISSQHATSHVLDDEETLILEEVSRFKMLAKQNDPMSKEKKVNTTPINYVELNWLSEYFENAYNDLLKSYSQLEKHCISLELTMKLNQEIFQNDASSDNQNALEIPEYFENNDLKAQLQAKDTTICKLKEHIKSIRENDTEEKVKQDMDELRP
ncbi:hypothetical protein Tco_1435644 [Tanacetum coccineum]